MSVKDLIDYLQRHLILHGDGPVVVETRKEVLDVEKADIDMFEAGQPWNVVLIAQEGDERG